jgi:hypothetical protein
MTGNSWFIVELFAESRFSKPISFVHLIERSSHSLLQLQGLLSLDVRLINDFL